MATVLLAVTVAAVGLHAAPGAPDPGLPGGEATLDQILHGRRLVITHDCTACHGGPGPDAAGWMAGGSRDGIGEYTFWRANLTPDPETGIGRYTDRQIFNALRYGLRPAATGDIRVTSSTPGVGGHPAVPAYLAPGMPWTSWRHMTDEELWAVVAYLRHGVRPVANVIPEPDVPEDGWASWFRPEIVGSHPMAPFPTANESLADGADLDQVLWGRRLVASLGCTECHGGRGNPAAAGWLAGVMSPEDRPHAVPFERLLQVGPFATYPRNLTPDNATGLGRFSERQLFNALRYGLRPGETADVEITSGTPGVGNHPLHPKYLPPSMPWPAWRHLEDEELRAIIAYLKHGVKPVRNRVPDSDGPPDFWVGTMTPENVGTYPAPPYPTERETGAPPPGL